jgi:putative DNA primase/helicase
VMADIDEMLDRMEPQPARPAKVIPYVAAPAPTPTKEPIPLLWATEFGALDEVRQLVEGVLTPGGFGIIFGPSNSGKTFIATHLCYCLSRGVPFFGKRVERSAVVYVAAEGADSVKRRVRAFEKHHGQPFGPFGLVPMPLCLMDPSADTEDLIDRIRVAEGEIGEKVGLIVIDTVQRVMAGADENAVEDMGRFVAAVDRLREETGAHVLAIHHSGKDASKGARGHSSLRAAVDTEIEVAADEFNRQHSFTITKQRDLPTKGETFTARFVPVEVSVDQWGQPFTSCAVEELVSPEKATQAKRLKPNEVAVLGYLAGQAAGVRRKVIVEALEKQGVSRAGAYRACQDLLRAGLATETLGLMYVPKG